MPKNSYSWHNWQLTTSFVFNSINLIYFETSMPTVDREHIFNIFYWYELNIPEENSLVFLVTTFTELQILKYDSES